MTEKTFGWELNVDLYDCSLEKISTKESLEKFLQRLCDEVLKVRRIDKPVMKRYGAEHLYGYSIFQLIEVSSIVGHFTEGRKAAYLDIFSCAPFDAKAVEKFAKEYFEAKKSVARMSERK